MTAAVSHGDGGGFASYHISTAGTVQLCACEGTGAARTIAASSSMYLEATYILP